MKDQAKSIAIKALKTFVQAALAFATVNFVLVKDRDTAKAFAVGLLAAGISAVWNTGLGVYETRK
jgi:glucose dehydrogenase